MKRFFIVLCSVVLTGCTSYHADIPEFTTSTSADWSDGIVISPNESPSEQPKDEKTTVKDKIKNVDEKSQLFKTELNSVKDDLY